MKMPTSRRTMKSQQSGSAAASASVLRDRKHQSEGLEAEAKAAALAPDNVSLSSTATSTNSLPPSVTGSGKPLDSLRRQHYAQRFGADFSKVRIHDDHVAAQQAEDMGANAFTHGNDIVLGRDHAPATAKGEQLLAHELAHAAQQQQPGATPTVQCDRRTPEGIGATPPDAPFTLREGISPEDGFVLFPQDNADLDSDDQATIAQLVGHPSHPVTVHVHGYASHDGGEEYNRNLSAHRAVAVKEYIERLLPAGSRVIAYAHGEVTEFGNLNANRRVGIDIIDETETPAAATESSDFYPGAYGIGGPRFDLDLNLRMNLDLDLLRALSPAIPPEPSLGSRLMAPVPQIPGATFDVGAIAPYYSQRGVPFPERDARSYEDHFNTWRDRFVLWGLTPDIAATLAQIGTEAAAETQVSIDYPTHTEQLDRMMGTEPTIVPVSDIMIWLFEQAR